MVDRAIGVLGLALALLFECLPFFISRIPGWIILTGIAAGIFLTGIALGLAIASTRKVRESSIATFTPSHVKLQFYGGVRIPEECSSENVFSWFAYFSPSLHMHAMAAENDATGQSIFRLPTNWVVFIVFDKPTPYREVVIGFSNPGLPHAEARFMQQRYVVVTIPDEIPEGVLSISIKN